MDSQTHHTLSSFEHICPNSAGAISRDFCARVVMIRSASVMSYFVGGTIVNLLRCIFSLL